jgi:hypothetical protein
MDLHAVGSVDQKGEEHPTSRTRKAALAHLIIRQSKVLESIRATRTFQFLFATAQLCHMDTALAERVWLDCFPRLWGILTEKQQSVSKAKLIFFFCLELFTYLHSLAINPVHLSVSYQSSFSSVSSHILPSFCVAFQNIL